MMRVVARITGLSRRGRGARRAGGARQPLELDRRAVGVQHHRAAIELVAEHDLDELVAAQRRHLHVDQDQVRPVLLQGGAEAEGRVEGHHGVSVVLQDLAHGLARDLAVVHDEDNEASGRWQGHGHRSKL
jgi:hypothetical protein